MKSALKKTAFLLCIVLVFTTLQFTSGTTTYANKAPWVDTLVGLLKSSSRSMAADAYKAFKSVNARAADWIAQDAGRLQMKPEDIFSGDMQNIFRLAQSLDNSVTEDMSLEEMLQRYGNAVQTRFENNLRNIINKLSDRFIVVKHKQLGGSHYAYTEGLSDDKGSPEGNESNFEPDSEMVLLTLVDKGDTVEIKEEVLLTSEKGVIRDPDVSADGLKVLFSWKKDNKDDFHLYEMNLNTKEIKQLTFGPGLADIEPKYLNNGKIVFSSTRIIQNVDCWKTPVSNLFLCDEDGKNIVRVGFDQVHTTYPTVTSDGRVLYTRWDYNDRNQMFVQGVFQMQADGTNQTELFGNDANFPTTLLHTREIPGETGKYVSIASGHHTLQAGKLVLIDIARGRNNPDAVTFVYPDKYSNKNNSVDGFGQEGPLYKYPYPINSSEFLVSFAPDGYAGRKTETPFGIYYMNSETKTRELLSESKNGKIGASQIVPVKTRTLFDRPNLVDYSSETGTFYIGDIYEGEGMEGVKRGEAKYLRVVALEFRTSAIGANQAIGVGSADPHTPVSIGNGSWDVKKVLGIVPIEDDGSVLFRAPARVPLYFQVLNEKGELIQSMRSWTTLMPGENYSCVGCHEDKNTVPPLYGSTTKAMLKGVQDIIPDFWQTGEGYENYDPYKNARGFSYMKEIQPILDKSCISCHNNRDLTLFADSSNIDINSANPIISTGSSWKYSTEEKQPNDWYKPSFDDSSWNTGTAPFGSEGTPPGGVKTDWKTKKIYIRKEFNITQQQLNSNTFLLNISYDENPRVYINGIEVFKESGYTTNYTPFNVTSDVKSALRAGKNVIAVYAENNGGGQFIDLGLYISNQAGSSNPNPISLKSDPIYASREKRNWPLSYLVLTQARWNGRGHQLIANSENKYTNWISAMSQCEILKPYQYGSSKSYLIKKLREGHGNLTDVEIRKIAAWIDLGVPMAGSYDEQAAWSANDMREYEEKNNKREYFEMADEMAVRALRNGGVYPDSRELTIIYISKDQEVARVKGNGLVQLISPNSYRVGDKIRVELPEGEKYLFFNLDTRIKEALIYVPDGVFEYEIPSYITRTMPNTVKPGTDVTFKNPMISARIPTQEDLQEVRNLALNPYDSNNNSKAFPHASASNSYGNGKNPEFDPRNAIDGFLNNLGHGNYPVQSWGPDNNVKDLWYQIDFGREVEVNSIAIKIRADFPHDTYFKSITLEFSDGSTQDIVLKKTADTQVFNLGNIKTTSIKLKDFKKASNTWAALTEIEVYGKNA